MSNQRIEALLLQIQDTFTSEEIVGIERRLRGMNQDNKVLKKSLTDFLGRTRGFKDCSVSYWQRNKEDANDTDEVKVIATVVIGEQTVTVLMKVRIPGNLVDDEQFRGDENNFTILINGEDFHTATIEGWTKPDISKLVYYVMELFRDSFIIDGVADYIAKERVFDVTPLTYTKEQQREMEQSIYDNIRQFASKYDFKDVQVDYDFYGDGDFGFEVKERCNTTFYYNDGSVKKYRIANDISTRVIGDLHSELPKQYERDMFPILLPVSGKYLV